MIPEAAAQCVASAALCPRDDKRSYKNEVAAQDSLESLRREGLSAYMCACGMWHLGHAYRTTT